MDYQFHIICMYIRNTWYTSMCHFFKTCFYLTNIEKTSYFAMLNIAERFRNWIKPHSHSIPETIPLIPRNSGIPRVSSSQNSSTCHYIIQYYIWSTNKHGYFTQAFDFFCYITCFEYFSINPICYVNVLPAAEDKHILIDLDFSPFSLLLMCTSHVSTNENSKNYTNWPIF